MLPSDEAERAAFDAYIDAFTRSHKPIAVCGNKPNHVKDLYILPIESRSHIPTCLLPYDGPGSSCTSDNSTFLYLHGM